MASHYEAPIRKPLVTGDKSYHDVTVDVAAPVEGNCQPRMVDCLWNCIDRLFVWRGMHHLHYFNWHRYLGTQQNCGLGLGHHEFCMVGWNWSRWNINLCSTPSFPSKMAYGH